MQYIVTKSNKTIIYSVEITDKDAVKDILSDIINKVGYTIQGLQVLSCDPTEASIRCELHRKLPDNTTPLYTDNLGNSITDIFKVLDAKEIQQGKVVINGCRRVVPELAYIIGDLLKGKGYATKRLIKYKDNDELLDIEERIDLANDAIDAYNMTETGYDVDVHRKLHDASFSLDEMRKNGEIFDAEKLRALYLDLLSLCEITPTFEIIRIKSLRCANPINGVKPQTLLTMLQNAEYFIKGSKK